MGLIIKVLLIVIIFSELNYSQSIDSVFNEIRTKYHRERMIFYKMVCEDDVTGWLEELLESQALCLIEIANKTNDTV